MYRIGIDLGGTNVKAGLVNEGFEILCQRVRPVDACGPVEKTVNLMAGMVEELMEEAGVKPEELLGAGIGSPGAVDSVSGVVLYSNNFGWENVPLAAMIRETLNLPVAIANDANCALMGEVAAGAARDCHDVVMLTLGTGVGGAVLADGRLLGSARGGGVLGHTIIHKDGRPCTCGRNGCLEAYASAGALVREMEKAVRQHPQSLLARQMNQSRRPEAKLVFQAADMGDGIAKALEEEYLQYLGDGICNLINIFRPEKLLLGGGICNRGEALIAPLRRYADQNCFAGKNMPLPQIQCAVLGNRAGIIGAAALIETGGCGYGKTGI